ncbi:MAG: cadherin-like beta sandwich domain-containing protein [Chloroflexi bacterium]|nr:cadherin-like beta sandwich domain-containing protein [Chloroflexota bacterium]
MAGRRTALKSGLAWALTAAVLVGLVGLLGLDGRPFVSAQGQSTDATLSGLTLSDVDFGTFASGTTSYTASVANTVTETTVTPTTTHSGASYVIKKNLNTDDEVISLSSGCNNITVEVTAEDGQTTQTYTVAVTVLDASFANLCDLKMSGIVVQDRSDGQPFRPSWLWYENFGGLPYATSQTTLTYALGDPEASVVIKVDDVEDDDGVFPLNEGFTTVRVSVTSEDGDTTTTYEVILYRHYASRNATLSALTLSDVDFGSFSRQTISYTVKEHEGVAHTTTETTVTAKTDHVDSSYVVKLNGVEDDDGVIPLATGDNVISVVVTAQDGTSTKTYTVTVKRPATVSTNARLRKLLLSDIDIGLGVGHGAYNSVHYLPWEASVSHDVSETTVTPEPWHLGSSYVVKIAGVEDADHTVSLAVGVNVITVVVTAEDGVTTESYTATITRAAANANTPAVGSPTINGTGQVGQALTASTSGISDVDGLTSVTYGYQWLADDTEIDGATSSTYTLQASDEDKVIKVQVTFTDDLGNDESLTSDGTAAIVPELAPDLFMGVLESDSSPAPGGSFNLSTTVFNIGYSESEATTLRFYRGTTPYLISPSDEEVGTNTVAAIAADGQSAHSIALTAPSTVGTYYYYACVDAVTDEPETVDNCTLDVSVLVNNAATGAPTISGTAQVGQTLTASTSDISDTDGLTNVSYSYQWLADDTEIDGATSSTYTVQSSDNGKVIKVLVTFTDDEGADESLTSAGTATVVTGGL